MGNSRKFKKSIKSNHNSLNNFNNNDSKVNNKLSQVNVITPELFKNIGENSNVSIDKIIGINLEDIENMDESSYKDLHKDLYIKAEILKYASELMTMTYIITNQYKDSNKLGKQVEAKFLPRIKQIYKAIKINLGDEYLSCVRTIVYEVPEYGVLLDRYWICFDGLDY